MSCGKTIAVLLGVLSIFFGYKISKFLEESPIPKFPEDQWWGPGKAAKVIDTSIKPFKIEFNAKVTKLKNIICTFQ